MQIAPCKIYFKDPYSKNTACDSIKIRPRQ